MAIISRKIKPFSALYLQGLNVFLSTRFVHPQSSFEKD
jgi:hypothetical protein